MIVSRRFHSLILRILHFRLLLAAALPDCKLILEAYHPSRTSGGNTYLYCTYLGTDGLSSKHEGEGSLYEDCAGEEGRFAKLGALYSRFRPERPTVTASMPLRRIAGVAPIQSPTGETSQPIYADTGDGGSTKVSHVLNLDADELFGQFCAYPQLVRFGPRRASSSVVRISSSTDRASCGSGSSGSRTGRWSCIINSSSNNMNKDRIPFKFKDTSAGRRL